MGVLVLIFLGWTASRFGRPFVFAGGWALFVLFSELALHGAGLGGAAAEALGFRLMVAPLVFALRAGFAWSLSSPIRLTPIPAIKLSKSSAIDTPPDLPDRTQKLSRIESIWWDMYEAHRNIKGANGLVKPAVADVVACIASELSVE